jgi:cytochrome P450
MTTEASKATPEAQPPPTDWLTDYDIFDPGYIKNPFPIWDELREKCPIAHTDRWLGSWMPTKYSDLFAIAQNWEAFSSGDVLVAPFGARSGYGQEDLVQEDEFAGVAAPPITSDPPEHTWSRRLLLPPFSIRSVEKFEPAAREHCQHLIDGFIANGKADAAADYAQQIPPYVIAMMLGVSTDMVPDFTQWTRDTLEFGFQDPFAAMESRNKLLTFMWGHIQERRKNPTDDLISYLVQQEVDGQPVSDQHILGTSFLLVLAGIDTTWSSIGSALWHLAQHPEDRQYIINNPDKLPNAVEELIRAYSPVTMARVVAKETMVDGRKMCPGEKVIMNFPAGNRDPEVFENPDQVKLDREKNPHIAFGVGIHRCAGSNLARMEMRIAIQEWLKRIPDFRLEDPDAVTWAGGQVRGPRSLPVVFP